jgi:hypothetical protein
VIALAVDADVSNYIARAGVAGRSHDRQELEEDSRMRKMRDITPTNGKARSVGTECGRSCLAVCPQ